MNDILNSSNGFILIVIAIIMFIKLMNLYCDKYCCNTQKSDESKDKPIQSINVSTNVIRYPSQVICDKCNANVFPLTKNIDSSTWDLKCSCGNIAYLHPQREERIEQIKNLLNY